MTRSHKFFLSGLLFVFLVVFTWLSIGTVVQAQTSADLGIGYASSTGLTTQDPRLVVAKIIRIGFGLLGTIGVILVIYAGFLWMTAAGNDDKIKKAKDILKAAVIGLIIILSAFAITSFIINKLVEATNGPGGQSTSTQPIITPINADFVITGSSPANGSVGLPRNTVIRFQFNGSVLASSITNATAQVINASTSEAIIGKWQVSGQEIVFQPDDICDSSCGEVHCLPKNTDIIVNLSTSIQSAGPTPKNLVCSSIGSSACKISFGLGSTVDCQDPSAGFISTIGVCVGYSNNLQVTASDDSGLARFEFLANDLSFNIQTGSFGINYTANTNWTPTGTVGTNFNLQALVDDVAGRRTIAQQNGRLLATHCCNQIKDGDETGLDCGGSCLGCEGAACATDMQSPTTTCNDNLCGSGFCTQQGSNATACQAAGYATGTAACCLCKNKPIISGLSPLGGFCASSTDQYCLVDEDCSAGGTCNQTSPNAKAGNLMTIIGSGFGTTAGKVIFTNDKQGDLLACGINSWSNNQIVVGVPAGVVTGPVEVINSDNFSATSAQTVLINNIARPGLCSLSKPTGTTNELITYSGLNFNNTDDFLTKALYGNLTNPIPANESLAGSSNSINARVPSLQAGQVTTFVRGEGDSIIGPASNFLLFNKLVDPGSQPQITGFSPSSGSSGQYVTIYGQSFGNLRSTSQVFFSNTEAGYNFPVECADSVWSDRQVVVKVPSGLSEGAVNLSMVLASGVNLSANEVFTVNTNPLAPSLCRISPTTGRVGSQVQVWGEYFKNYDSASSRVRFSQNINVTTSNWFFNSEVSSASSTIPITAVSGPVQIVNDSGVSNGLNLRVGVCQTDNDCQGQICCPISSPLSGQCSTGMAGCYGTSASCVYNWSFTTGSGNNTCPANTTLCGNKCCDDSQQCQNSDCVNKELLSCNDYDQCNGALYCPNSPGWCSQETDPTVGGGCGDNYCQTLFQQQGLATSSVIYSTDFNACIVNSGQCDQAQTEIFQLNFYNQGSSTANQVAFPLTCQNSKWTTSLTHGQCPPETSEYDSWQLLAGNVCQSAKSCTSCNSKLTCLSGKDKNYCGLEQTICATGFTCQDNQCQQTANSCECCCDQKLNNSLGNPGCCAPLTCGGTCGSGTSTDGTKVFGVCSGCVAAGSSTTTRDAACNCSGSIGKYCNTATTNGSCGDCAQITDLATCTSHSTCCYDQATKKCRGVVDGNRLTSGPNSGFCGYYTCNGAFCSDKLAVTGQFATAQECDQACRVVSLQGQSCSSTTVNTNGVNHYNNLPNIQTIGCGYQLCAAPLSCRVASGISATSTNQADCGVCCCDPDNDQCSQLSINLFCVANKGQCSGAGRGLCCGCQQDSDCGNSQQNGCGRDNCCQARPSLITTLPADGSANVCRNAAIKATFDQSLDLASLQNNILLIADYGTAQQCPAGTNYLALNQNNNQQWWSKLRQKLLAWFRPSVLARLPAIGNTYCAINKEIDVVGHDVIIRPNSILAAGRTYFIALVTDSNTNDNQAEGILSQAGIGIAGGQPLKFNNLHLAAARQWSFTTGNQVCQIHHVELDPASVLFSDLLATTSLAATAVSASGQILQASSVYDWDWSWSVGNQAIIQMVASDSQAVIQPKNQKDADTYIRATAQVTIDQTGGVVENYPSFSRDAAIKVFLCANPWPARQDDGSWQPWTDYATNMQFYYCRDGQTGTQANDLPGLKVVSSTDETAINPAFYFFRYNPATTSPTNLTATAVPAGGAIRLNWNTYPSATGYKIYYGLRSGQYFSYPLSISGTTTAAISDLINGQRYYVAISAILQIDEMTFAETPLSPEISILVLDTRPPATVSCLEQVIGKNRIDLSWRRNQDDTVAYLVEYRSVGSTNAGQTMTVSQPTVSQPISGRLVNATITNLFNAANTLVEVKAVDQAGNISAVQNNAASGCE
jgi:hypothetical protein